MTEPGSSPPATAARASDPAHFRAVLGHFVTGVTVVTATAAGLPVGVTCQSFSALSLDPPLVALFAGRSSSTWPRVREAGVFTVNVLAADQERLSRVFGTRGLDSADRFAGVRWRAGPVGTPVLDGVLAWVDCALESEVETGDHVVLVGRVLDLEVERPGAAPLLFFRGSYGTLDP